MRANICRGVDLDKLDRAILEFEQENFCYCFENGCNYLIMSKDTLNVIISEDNEYVLKRHPCENIVEYKCNKIAIDNSIPYGEVEIR